jgi:DNA topoisomerase-1
MFSTDPLQSAAEAGLRYVVAGGPCIQRIRCGRFFRYQGPDGKPLRDPGHLQRIRSLAIPPAWKNVWICPSANGHLQAVGWDAKGRKQYRYHPQYRSVRDQAKFSRMIAFGTVLALIRRNVGQDLDRAGLPREKVLATVVRLLETTFIRVGNDEYAKENDSFGLTTLRSRHVRIDGATLLFSFRGKSGLEHTIELTDARLARIVRQCRELPGYELFRYVNEAGEIGRVDSADVNCYIRKLCGQDFTAKDFRTWAGTVLAARELHSAGPPASATAAKRTVVKAIKTVARRLGNRPATARKYYIHPAIPDAYADGTLFPAMARGEEQNTAYAGLGLRPEEYSVMVLIAEYQGQMAKAPWRAFPALGWTTAPVPLSGRAP